MRWLAVLLAVVLGSIASSAAMAADEGEVDWAAVYQTAWERQGGGLIAGGAGVGLALVGTAVVSGFGGCGLSGDVCEGPYLGDGLIFVGVVVGDIGSMALAFSSLRGRRALKMQGVQRTKAPGLIAIALGVASIGSTAGWLDFRRPIEALPHMPAIRSIPFYLLNVGLLAGSYGLGIAETVVVRRAGAELKRQVALPRVWATVTPWTDGRARGAALVGVF